VTSSPFRVALSASFQAADGSPVYPSFALSPLTDNSNIDLFFLPACDPIDARLLDDADALILLSERFNADSIPASDRLALVARFGVGYDSVDVAACTDRDIAVTITPDGVRRPVAVSIITLMLALTGKLMIKDRLTRRGPDGFNARSDHMGTGVTGLTLGSVGIGNIGAEMFRMAKPLDMRFIAHDPYADANIAQELGVELVDLDTLFTTADVLTVNCPLTDDTRHLVDAKRLAQMKSTAYLINTARGPIVDQQALTHALETQQLAGAGIDVFETEPPAADDPLLTLDNVIVTPHALCWTDQCFAGIGASAVASVLDIAAGQSPVGLLNQQVLARRGFQDKLARGR
jgi:D-3-phosphoglycerate dehydrogenase